MFSFAGSTLLLLAFFFSGFTLFSGISWLSVMDGIGGGLLRLYRYSIATVDRLSDSRKARQIKRQRNETFKVETKRSKKRAPLRIEPVIKKVETGKGWRRASGADVRNIGEWRPASTGAAGSGAAQRQGYVGQSARRRCPGRLR